MSTLCQRIMLTPCQSIMSTPCQSIMSTPSQGIMSTPRQRIMSTPCQGIMLTPSLSSRVGSISVLSMKEKAHTTSSSFLESSSPNNNMYTLPSSITVNSYASLHKTPIAYFTPTLSVYSCHHSPVNTYTYAHPMGSGGSNSQSSVGGSSSILNMEEDSLEEKTNRGTGSRKPPCTPRAEVVVDPTTLDFRERFKMLQVSSRYF